MNLYFNNTNRPTSSGLGKHNESDRFSTLTSITFTSSPDIKTVLSINQGTMHQTSEVELPSFDKQVVTFNS